MRARRSSSVRRSACDPNNDGAKANLELLFNYTGPTSIEADSTGGFGGFGEEGGARRRAGGY